MEEKSRRQTHLGTHKSEHVETIKESKNDWNDDHHARNGKNRRQERDETKVRPAGRGGRER